MEHAGKYALDSAKEITIAAMQYETFHADKNSADGAAIFFETVYRKIKELADDVED